MRSAYLFTKRIYSGERQNCLLCGIPVYTKSPTRPMCQQQMLGKQQTQHAMPQTSVFWVNKCQSATKVHKLIYTFVPIRSDIIMPIRITKYLISKYCVVTVGRRVPIWKCRCLTVTFQAFPNLLNRSVNVKASCRQNMFLTRRRRIVWASKLCIME
jgi:hypothetical protein